MVYAIILVKKREVTVVNLLHLRYFVELARTEHYTRAAEKLCITQPSLSHAIAQLESELGFRSLRRAAGARSSPTSASSSSPARGTPWPPWTRAWRRCSGWAGGGRHPPGTAADPGGPVRAGPGGPVSGGKSGEGHPLHLPHRCHQPAPPGPFGAAV